MATKAFIRFKARLTTQPLYVAKAPYPAPIAFRCAACNPLPHADGWRKLSATAVWNYAFKCDLCHWPKGAA